MAMWDNWDNREWQSPEQMRSLAEVSRLNALISDEEMKINNIYCQIGKLYATIHRSDSEEEFADLVAAAQESKSKIEEYRAEILDVKGLVRCPQCGMELPKAAAFCMACGTSIPKVETPAPEETETPAETVCANCGAELAGDALFCAQCGTSVQAAADPTPVEDDTCEKSVEVSAAEEETPTRFACGNCGAVLDYGALFCAQCGVSMKDAAVPYVAEEGPWDKSALDLDSFEEETPVETPEEPDCDNGEELAVMTVPADLDEEDTYEEPVAAPAVEAVTEELSAEVPEEPAYAADDDSSLLISIPALDEEDGWGEPVEEPVVETFEEEPPVKVSVKLACANCGADLEDDALFCTECGTPVKAAATPEPEENDSWDEPVAAPALYIVKEEPPVEIPEKPLGAPTAGFGVLMAPSDLDDDDMWGEPVAAPTVEELPEELPVEAPAKPACANCGAELEEDMMFCTECGTPVAKAAASEDAEYETCPSCGATVEKGMKFCTECGTPMEVQAVTVSGKHFCLTCGAVLEDGMLFCTECGTRA